MIRYRSFFQRLSLMVFCALVLASCSQGKFIAHTSKRMQNALESPGQGMYKIGEPYQIDGIWYYPSVDYRYMETGIASWYGSKFHKKKTANGGIYDMNKLTAAHRTLPMPSFVRVTNLENGRSLVLKVNDRGPYANNRIIDVSRRGAQLLGFEKKGTARA
ncbi:MAG TPA: septal ring lytic transglycosylase RlpA family protein, partial [Rhodospirillales bacterium]|nr:septal ring lytic transglycosylase RlpA family protein [Rhodospirillales bacterium]